MEVYFLADGKREDGEGVLVADGIGVPKKRFYGCMRTMILDNTILVQISVNTATLMLLSKLLW